MICPACASEATKVLKSLDSGTLVQRRRFCCACNARWTTEEALVKGTLVATRGQQAPPVAREQPPVATNGDGGVGGGLSGDRSDLSGSVPDPILSLSPDQGVDRARAKRDKRAGEPPAFLVFWAAYPRKVARAKALQTWIKIDPNQDLIQLIQSSILAQRAGFLAREPDKVPHAATWLNGERWNDSIEGAPRVNGRLNAVDRKTEEIRQSFEQGRAWAANLAKGGT